MTGSRDPQTLVSNPRIQRTSNTFTLFIIDSSRHRHWLFDPELAPHLASKSLHLKFGTGYSRGALVDRAAWTVPTSPPIYSTDETIFVRFRDKNAKPREDYVPVSSLMPGRLYRKKEVLHIMGDRKGLISVVIRDGKDSGITMLHAVGDKKDTYTESTDNLCLLHVD
jgi:hypothetical protein